MVIRKYFYVVMCILWVAPVVTTLGQQFEAPLLKLKTEEGECMTNKTKGWNNFDISEDIKSVSDVLKVTKRFKLRDSGKINDKHFKLPVIKNGKVFTQYAPNSYFDLESGNKIDFGSERAKEQELKYVFLSSDSSVLVNIHNNETILKNAQGDDFISFPDKIINYRYIVDGFPEKDFLFSYNIQQRDTIWKKQFHVYDYFHSGKYAVYDGRKGNLIFDMLEKYPLYKIKEDVAIEDIYVYNNIFYLSNFKKLYALDIRNRNVIWCRIFNQDNNNIILEDDVIYTYNLMALDAKNGAVKWNKKIRYTRRKGIIDDYVLGTFAGGHSPSDVILFMLNKNTGKMKYSGWYSDNMCKSCFNSPICIQDFTFALKGYKNKTAAIIECDDGLYLYLFELKI